MELSIGVYSLEKMIGYIAKINEIEALQFTVYEKVQRRILQGRSRKK